MNLSFAPLLGVMKFEVPPVTFTQYGIRYYPFPGGRMLEIIVNWMQDVGGFAMLGLVFWLLNGLMNPVYDIVNGQKRNRLVTPWMLILSALAIVFYLVTFGLMWWLSGMTDAEIFLSRKGRILSLMEWAYEYSFALGGFFAILAFAGPVFMDIPRFRIGRIYAIAKLSFKEAFRRRIVWVFLSILVLYLFPARWFFREKPEDELKSIIDVTTRGMNVLLISVGLLLASFSIPNDIKSLTIHTIVTKPVERFELVLGRFFGYLGIITMALALMTGLGLLLINTGNLAEEAAEESFKSRVALYGDMEFSSKKTADFVGIDVGREDVYRKYIAGASSHTAVWSFKNVPDVSGQTDPMPLEFAFDVYRTTKGEEGRGVFVSFDLMTHKWDPSREAEFNTAMQGLVNVKPEDPAKWEKVDKVAEEFGRYLFKSLQIYDYHTSSIPVPAGLFRNAASGDPSKDEAIQVGGRPLRRLQVTVRCDTPTQFVGVAKYDLYILESEGNFSFNYFKGSIGLWFRLIVAIAIAVACSTYLAGVLSFLCALFLFIGGFFLEFIQELALNLNVGGGPFESLTRLINKSVAAAELDPTPTIRAVKMLDGGYRWVLRRVMNVIPNVDSYGLSEYVAQGFNIGPEFLLVNFVLLLGYILPWLVAAYYLMKAREIAA
ncbi:ABC transporter permease [Zavarzinella formosa]|uniref:ABC transporter permease n=1 Tax=Zavarzinella formosa TaxID=360055 RepID=UPI0002D6382B|nr:hypothetical protein [Zavarzinella formosa]